MKNGMYIARVIVPHQCQNIPIRLLNNSARSITLHKGTTLTKLEPVNIVDESTNEVPVQDGKDNVWKDSLLARVGKDISDQTKDELDQILTNYADCFSKSE